MSIPLIQALYDSTIPFPKELEFYNQAIKEIEYFSISPQIYYLLKQQRNLQKVPPFFQDRLEKAYKSSLYQSIFIKHQTERILEAFDTIGIEVIPIKGVNFAEEYFGNLGARGTSDIDLLVKKKDLKIAIDCIKSLGFTLEGARVLSHFHYTFSKPLPHSPVPITVELHWDLLKENTSYLNINEFWDQASPLHQYKYIKKLSDYHTFYLICLHGWKHNMLSLKYFIDIIQMIHVLNKYLDFTVLIKDAAAHGTLKRIIRTLSIVYNLFPELDSVKEFPYKKKSNLHWEYQHIRHDSKSVLKYLNYIHFLFFNFDTVKHSLVSIFRWLFPSTGAMLYELEITGKRSPLIFEYFKLFKKRFLNFLQSILQL